MSVFAGLNAVDEGYLGKSHRTALCKAVTGLAAADSALSFSSIEICENEREAQGHDLPILSVTVGVQWARCRWR